MKKTVFSIISLFLLLGTTSFAQTLEGYVLDKKTQEPLYGVSVYFDGTTIGTSTNDSGKFKIKYGPSIESSLVVSFIGYQPMKFDVRTLEQGVKIYLSLRPQALGTVYIKNKKEKDLDPWSRAKKLKIFKREFLGPDVTPDMCKVLNLEDVELTFNPITSKLTATSELPLTIENPYMGYTIIYELREFEVNLEESVTGEILINSVYTEGTSFYKEHHPRVRDKHRITREEEYEQSILYFMRCLSKKNLKENGFQISQKGHVVPPYRYFRIEPLGDDTRVKMITQRVDITYDKKYLSILQIQGKSHEFTINKFGNYSPGRGLFFGGELSKKRIAKTLPLDYGFGTLL